jgi:glycosyltransferase involved in cell wall biosynthesis
MASDPVLAGPAEPAAAAPPDVTVVVPVLNEEATLQPLYDGVSETLAASGIAAELIFVDDGSTDGTFAVLERLHAADPRVRVVSFKRNFGQHPAMHAGIARVDAGADVASGRRVTRRDPMLLRRLPSLLINRLLARLTGARVADFGCAFNAYRRDALEPVMHRIGRQKFTKALVCSTGARVTEVDLDHRARADRSRYGVVSLVKLALHVLTGFWAQLVQWLGTVLGVLGILTAFGVGLWGMIYWIRNGNFPGPLLLGGLVLFVLGLQGFLMAVVGENLQRIQRDVEGRPLYYIERELG